MCPNQASFLFPTYFQLMQKNNGKSYSGIEATLRNEVYNKSAIINDLLNERDNVTFTVGETSLSDLVSLDHNSINTNWKINCSNFRSEPNNCSLRKLDHSFLVQFTMSYRPECMRLSWTLVFIIDDGREKFVEWFEDSSTGCSCAIRGGRKGLF